MLQRARHRRPPDRARRRPTPASPSSAAPQHQAATGSDGAAGAVAGPSAVLGARGRHRWPVLAVPLVLVIGLVAAGALWVLAPGGQRSDAADIDPPTAAVHWLGDWVPAAPVLVDDGFAGRLGGAAWPPGRAVTPASCTGGGCRAEWLVSTSRLRAEQATRAPVAATTSSAVAVFGSGDDRVEIRHVGPVPPDGGAAERRARTTIGRQVSAIPGLVVDPGVRALLDTGQVDPRALAALAAVSQLEGVHVRDLPAIPGEDAAGQPRRRMLLSPPTAGIDTLRAYFAVQDGPFRPTALDSTDDGLSVSYPPPAPEHLLDAVAGP